MKINSFSSKPKFVLLFFIVWPLIASLISLTFNFNIFCSVVVFLVVPSVILSFLLPQMIRKVAIFSFASGLPFSIIIDYIANFTKQWVVLTGTFPKFLGYIHIEVIIWVVCFLYFVVMFYEYFIDFSPKNMKWNPRMKILVGFLWGLLVMFFIFYFLLPNALNIPYFYLVIGLLFMVIPSIIELLRRPRLLSKFLLVGAYFFFFNFIYELTALKLGQWTFLSTQYVGWVAIRGLQFPFEEFFFGFFFYAMIALVCYEAFDCDEK